MYCSSLEFKTQKMNYRSVFLATTILIGEKSSTSCLISRHLEEDARPSRPTRLNLFGLIRVELWLVYYIRVRNMEGQPNIQSLQKLKQDGVSHTIVTECLRAARKINACRNTIVKTVSACGNYSWATLTDVPSLTYVDVLIT